MSDELMFFIQANCLIVWAVAQTLFIGLWLFRPWFRTYIGRAMFFKSLSMMFLVDDAVVGLMFDWPWEEEQHTLVLVLGMTGSIWQLFAWVRQRTEEFFREVEAHV
jgi:predicted alpha/beta-fold hydrolase